MSAGSGEKRRRRRDRQFVELQEKLAQRTALLAIAGTLMLLASVAVRSYWSSADADSAGGVGESRAAVASRSQ
jgi:hypothetical protein